MRRDFKADLSIWIWQSDGSGTEIDADLLNAARRNWGRVLAYALRYEPDAAVAANIFEETLLAASKARKRRLPSAKPIRNLDSYLYVAFVRSFHRYLAKQPHLEYVGSDQDLDARVRVNLRTPCTMEDNRVRDLEVGVKQQ